MYTSALIPLQKSSPAASERESLLTAKPPKPPSKYFCAICQKGNNNKSQHDRTEMHKKALALQLAHAEGLEAGLQSQNF